MESVRITFDGNRQREKLIGLLKENGFKRVENAFWVEIWQNGNREVILERE